MKKRKRMARRKKKDVKKVGAIELSMGTIVILVLSMVALIGGIILLTSIFSSGNEAIGNIDQGVKKAIKDAFADPNKKLVVYPSERDISIKTRTQGKGFAFSVRNVDIEDHDYIYNIYVDPNYDIKEKCKISAKEAEGWLLTDTGTLSVGRGSIMEEPELVKFTIPESAPPCTIIYKMDVNKRGGDFYVSTKVYLTIKSR
ncbi:hypothetical protein GOV12_07280 [Candidatus Pacearchaeota archaeon]|nr:hypothetical protein [Candidatus Pacearchaeota archaeon]